MDSALLLQISRGMLRRGSCQAIVQRSPPPLVFVSARWHIEFDEHDSSSSAEEQIRYKYYNLKFEYSSASTRTRGTSAG